MGYLALFSHFFLLGLEIKKGLCSSSTKHGRTCSQILLTHSSKASSLFTCLDE